MSPLTRLPTDVLLIVRDQLSAYGQSRALLNAALASRQFYNIFEPGLTCETLTLNEAKTRAVLGPLLTGECESLVSH